MRTPRQEAAAAALRLNLSRAPSVGGIALLAAGILAPLSGAPIYYLLFALLGGLVYGGFAILYWRTQNILFLMLGFIAIVIPSVASFEYFFGYRGSETTAAHFLAAGAYISLAILSSSMLCLLLRRWWLHRLDAEEAGEPPVPVEDKPVAPQLGHQP